MATEYIYMCIYMCIWSTFSCNLFYGSHLDKVATSSADAVAEPASPHPNSSCPRPSNEDAHSWPIFGWRGRGKKGKTCPHRPFESEVRCPRVGDNV